MRTLVYKRTHNGDPDSLGRFGCHDCMGGVRSWPFEAFIGVGGQGAAAESNDIACKVNWIGIGPHKSHVEGMDDPIVTFDHFRDFGIDGPLLHLEAPHLARHMYVKKARVLMAFTAQEQAEVDKLLALAREEPPSPGLPTDSPAKRPVCRRKICRPSLLVC
jgi:hypothetical protein